MILSFARGLLFKRADDFKRGIHFHATNIRHTYTAFIIATSHSLKRETPPRDAILSGYYA